MNGWTLAFMLATQTLPKHDVTEFRPRITFSGTANLSASTRVHVDVLAEALAGSRKNRTESALVVEPREAWIETGNAHVDLRVGIGRIAWGRLDEVQPSDVINPIDTARFFMDGRADARLPVGFARARWFASEAVTVEGVLVPFFRRSTFDSLDEASSAFNLIDDAALPNNTVVTGIVRHEPPASWSDMQGGGRASLTAGRVDLSASVYRGFETFGDVSFVGAPQPSGLLIGQLEERFNRFTMIAGDVETVIGAWAWRGEAAWRVDTSFDAGAGFDRKTGDFRVFGSVLVHRTFANPLTTPATNIDVVGSIERKFARDRILGRVFAVLNPHDRSGFMRGLLSWSASDRVAIDVSAAKFAGTGDDDISKFAGRDFVLARVRWYVQ